MPNRILAVDDDEINLKLVIATLQRAGYEIITAHNGLEAIQQAEKQRPDLILLDVMMPEIDGYEVCRRLRLKQATARIPVMMLTALDSVAEKIKGFEAGADDYLPKPFAPDELQARVKVLMRRAAVAAAPSAPALHGKIISVYSLRGGSGVTSLSANLAAGLSAVWGQPAVLVDLCLAAGQSALMFNLPFRRTWADLSATPPTEIEADLVKDLLLQHPGGTRILAAAPRPEQGEGIDASRVTRTLDVLRTLHPYLVVDLPHDFAETTLAGLDSADAILLMMTPELASVRAMVCALGAFDSLGYDPRKVHVVLNWTFQKNGLSKKDIETAIKRNVELVIPFAPEAFVAGINLGNPPVLANPTSPLGALFEDIAFLFSDEAQKKQRPRQPTDAWNRAVNRLRQRQQK